MQAVFAVEAIRWKIETFEDDLFAFATCHISIHF